MHTVKKMKKKERNSAGRTSTPPKRIDSVNYMMLGLVEHIFDFVPIH